MPQVTYGPNGPPNTNFPKPSHTMTPPDSSEPATSTFPLDAPDTTVSALDLFGFDTDRQVPAFSVADEHVPEPDP